MPEMQTNRLASVNYFSDKKKLFFQLSQKGKIWSPCIVKLRLTGNKYPIIILLLGRKTVSV